jgi:uncharacterized protein YcfJ
MSISISRHWTTVAVAAAISLAGASAFAQDGRYDDDDYRPRPAQYDPRSTEYDPRHDPRYDDGAYDYARVIDAEPLTRRIRVTTPRRECWDEVRYDDRGHRGGRSSSGGALLGAVIGGVIGSQIGSGRGRDAATAAGAVIGAGVGHREAERRNAGGPPPREYTVQRCETRYQDSYEERIDGYRVTYEYHGRRHVTQLPYNPGDRIRVRVDVSPAE